jgi:peptidoglycan hydrolase-like protein with peptidoglycan-binding domain
MNKKLLTIFVVALVAVPLALVGCKSKTDKMPEEMRTEATETPVALQEAQVAQVTEPSQTVATETIPPTAAPQIAEKAMAPVVEKAADRSKEVQTALKNAGFYAGTIDGKIGPKTKKAIEDFQKAKGLKIDGKVGPKTWAELEKYLTPQQ